MCAAVLVAAAARCGAAETAVVKAGAVHTVKGDVLAPGMILIVDGRIAEVGKEIPEPEGAAVYKAEVAVPGFIDAASVIGVAPPRDEESCETTPRVRAADAFDAAAPDVAAARMQGITLARIGPGNRNVFGGMCALVTTYGATARDSIVRDEAALKASLDPEAVRGNRSWDLTPPRSPFFRRPTTRMALVQMFTETLERAKEARAGLRPATLDLEAIGRVPAGELPLHVYTRTAFDLRALLDASARAGVAPVIEGGIEVHRELGGIKARGLAVILTPEAFGAVGALSGAQVRASLPALLADSEVPFALATAGFGLEPLDLGALAVRHGLAPDRALRALTLAPARILGIDGERGSITAGAVADIVLLSGAPFAAGTRVVQVIGNGKLVFPKGGGR
ncbi:MAG: amidohydrolase family protein [Planctomycetes bacterium]|jgi:imidazolonepropionase-like amidohydrolase|nr:amidohydrolase family protein [Planctomycetota bacterium]